MTDRNKQRREAIFARKKAIEGEIEALIQERRKLSKELKSLNENSSFSQLLEPLLVIQNKWSVERPGIKLTKAGSQYRMYYGSGPRFAHGDLIIQSAWEQNRRTKKYELTVYIYNGWRCVFKTKKSYAAINDMITGAPEQYYQAVLKSVNKLVNEQEQGQEQED